MGFLTWGGLQGCGYRSLSQLIVRAPDAGQAFILILFLAFCDLVRLFIPLYFLKYYGFNDQKPLRLAKFSGIFFFLAVLGLHFCARVFSSCDKRGSLFIAVRGPLTIAASLVAEHRLQTRRLSNCGSRA